MDIGSASTDAAMAARRSLQMFPFVKADAREQQQNSDPDFTEKSGVMNQSEKMLFCSCGWPQRWADDDSIPVEYDDSFEEFSIVHNREDSRSILHYCPVCGGKLTKYSYNKTEDRVPVGVQAKILAAIRGVRNERELRSRLGDPTDEIRNCQIIDGQVYSVLKYSDRFPDVVLIALVSISGDVSISFNRKEQG
jgi:hypothetical protein